MDLQQQQLSINDIEIMAPAGSYESLMAAINAGANSIYFGIEGLNMRSKSAYNFTKEDLYKIVAICQENQVKSYLTINTIIYDNDLDYMRQLIDAAAEAQVSAVIAADVAVMTYARSKGLEVHLSTQLNISNVEALQFYAQFADVVVLARELNMQQVEQIHKEILQRPILGPKGKAIQIEMFVHGALCMAVSGKCYLSLHELNKSANRGSCGQICRRSYKVSDATSNIELSVENENIMSPKDLKTVHFLNKMIDAGVRVFKIEGRARGPEYVDTVVRCYKEAAQAVIDNQFTLEKIKEWDKRLATVFNRGFWDGYYLGKRLGEWTPIYGSSATKQKIYKAKVTNFFSKLSVAELELEAGSLKKGDEILITGPTTGIVRTTLDEIRCNLEITEVGEKGSRISIPVPSRVRTGDRVYVFENRKDIQKTY